MIFKLVQRLSLVTTVVVVVAVVVAVVMVVVLLSIIPFQCLRTYYCVLGTSECVEVFCFLVHFTQCVIAIQYAVAIAVVAVTAVTVVLSLLLLGAIATPTVVPTVAAFL